MAHNSNGQNGWRTDPLYTFSEAARLAHVHPSTVRRWIYGEQVSNRQMQAVFGRPLATRKRLLEVSFLQLAEIVVVSQFRRKPIPLQRIRKAHGYARKTWGLDYPFARLSLRTDGVRVLREYEETEPGMPLLVLAQESGQWTLPDYVSEAVHSFDHLDDLASRWFPIGKSVPIVIDPQFSAGVPTIPERHLTISAIHKRWQSGLPMDFIADDYKLDRAVIEKALRYAEKVVA